MNTYFVLLSFLQVHPSFLKRVRFRVRSVIKNVLISSPEKERGRGGGEEELVRFYKSLVKTIEKMHSFSSCLECCPKLKMLPDKAGKTILLLKD